ncbi:MAG: response regulator [Kofleriaceae bacterium]|nr:response regulator [Kofleriaceae bacterium]
MSLRLENEGVVQQEMDDVDTSPVFALRQILVVDDTPANLVAAEAALAPLNRTIVMANSGQDALARLLEQDFALVLLDVHMPGMDGFETARWIRSRERTQHLPIIFTTAHSHTEASVLRAYSLGAVDFLFKPIVPEVLRAKVSVFCTLQERTAQLAAERLERDFENRRRDYENLSLRRERDREQAANKELARLNEALATNDRRKDSFIAILAHELRNPLAPIRTALDLIRQTPERQPEPKMLDILERQTTVLSRLVDDLLDLSRIKADKIELRPELIDLVTVAETAISSCRPMLEDRRHTIVFDAPTDKIKVIVDTIRFGQIISNLLSNAARYTAPGGRIEVSCGTNAEGAYIRVRDNGIGIPEDLQRSIFKMFVQERVRSDGSGGLGLGLALARRLVEMHKGEITVESEGRDKGSTFEITIPLASSPNALAIRKRTEDMQPLRLPEPVARRTIRTVVIDDNDDARELLADLLKTKGYEVISAADGTTGVDLIRQHRPDLALVDLGLPGLDGIGVVEELRTLCPDLKTRLVALTGYGEASDRERTQKAGFHAHLVKPATAAALFACLTQQLEETS